MRIVTVIKTSTGASWLLPLMSALLDSGHEPVVLLPQPDGPLGSRLRAAGITVTAAAAPAQSRSPLAQLRGVWRLRAQLRELRPDVLHYHLYASALSARFASLGLGVPRVHMVPGPLYLENPVINAVERWLCRLDDIVICTSDHLRDRYQRLGLPSDRLPVIPYGVDCNRFTPASDAERGAARMRLSAGPDDFVALCVAYIYAPKRLVHRGAGIKGHEVLLAAWSRFVSAGGRGRLLFVGSGFGPAGEQHREQLRAAGAGLAGADSVTWVDGVEDVRAFYAAVDVSVSPSLSENYGAVAEASACGVPSIASAVGGMPELVDAGTGYLVPPRDVGALTQALHDAARDRDTGALTHRGAAARRRALERLQLGPLMVSYTAWMESLGAPDEVRTHR